MKEKPKRNSIEMRYPVNRVTNYPCSPIEYTITKKAINGM